MFPGDFSGRVDGVQLGFGSFLGFPGVFGKEDLEDSRTLVGPEDSVGLLLLAKVLVKYGPQDLLIHLRCSLRTAQFCLLERSTFRSVAERARHTEPVPPRFARGLADTTLGVTPA